MMKNTLLVTFAALGLFAGTSAFGADVYRGDNLSVKDGPSASPTFPNVAANGFYVDFGVGGAVQTSIGKSDTTVTVPANTTVTVPAGGLTGSFTTPVTYQQKPKFTISPSGLTQEIRLGYDWRIGRAGNVNWFAGPYASVGYSEGNIEGFSYAAGGELGVEIGNSRLKAFVGYTGQHSAQAPATFTGFSEDLTGLQVGGEVQTFWTQHTYTFLRAKDDMYGKFNVGSSATGDAYKVDTNVVTGMIGVGVKF